MQLSEINQRLAVLNAKGNRGQRLSTAEVRELGSLARMAVPLINRAIGEAKATETRFAFWLRQPGHETLFEARAAGEGTGSTGGYLVPPGFNASLIHYMREFDGLLKAFEHWESDHGQVVSRPAFSQFSAGATATENAAFTEGPYPTLANQSWPIAPTFAASYRASLQLMEDAGINLGQWIAQALGESLGRAVAPVAQTALYAAISTVGAVSDSGGYLTLGTATPVTFATGATTELAANTISLDTAAQMTAAIDEAYGENAAYYMTRAQWKGILRQVSTTDKKVQINPSESDRSLYGYPVVLTSQTTAATASTVSGPVFGDLGAAMTLRTVNDGQLALLRSTEKYAEYLQTYFRAVARADVAPRDTRAVVGVQYAAS